MSCKIVADRLTRDGGPVPFVRATSQGGRITPEAIVLHDTADRPDKDTDTINYFASKDCKVSAHFVVGRDGKVVQMVECDRKAHHAGASSYKGRQYCNGFTIGIEIDNPGKLDKNGRAWFHKAGEPGIPTTAIEPATTKAHGSGYWMQYTPAQVEAVIEICRALVAAYPTIHAITTHWEISPGRKIDPNPLFPLEEVRKAVFPPRAESPAAISSLSLGSEGYAVTAVQKRLLGLGYPVGLADGKFGSRTRASVLAFEAENGLATDGVLTAAERAVLEGEAAKPMPAGAREDATVADLAPKSQTMQDLGALQKAGLTTAAVSVGVGVSGGTEQPLSNIAQEASYVETIVGVAKSAFATLGDNLWIAGLALGFYLLWKNRRLVQRRLEEFRQGRWNPSGGL